MTRPPVVEPLPPKAPQRYPRVVRWIAKVWLRYLGWRLVGQFPNESQVLFLAAPHSSAWDALYGLLIKVAAGADIRFGQAKPSGFRSASCAHSARFRSTGGPRMASSAKRWRAFAAIRTLMVLLAPEGTRKAVKMEVRFLAHRPQGQRAGVLHLHPLPGQGPASARCSR
jgi:hypothetical protein